MKQIRDHDALKDAIQQSGIGDWDAEIYCVVYVRAGFCCEYCGQDQNGSLNTYLSCDIDHILPKKYKHLGGPSYCKISQTGTGFLNLALSCRACNKLKRDFDPGKGIIDVDITDLTPNLRNQLIGIARKEVHSRRNLANVDYLAIQDIVERHARE